MNNTIQRLNTPCPYELNYVDDTNIYQIDAVIYYVDSADCNWRSRYNKELANYKVSHIDRKGNPTKKNRISDYGTLKYVLRSIDKYLKFIKNVYLVVQSDTQVPDWINRETVHVVYHHDFIPQEFLPTYNSTTMDMFIHRIPGLSERFLMFNDDMIAMREMNENNFFHGFEICEVFYRYDIDYEPTYGDFYKQWRINAENIICKEFEEELKQFHEPPHGIGPMIKSDIEYLFNKYSDDILNSITQFRSHINIENYLWRLYSWKKHGCKNIGAGCKVINNSSDNVISDIISAKNVDAICINDIGRQNNYHELKKNINIALQYHFPEASKYEKQPKVACCVISKNEEKYLIEWVEYYKSIGFDNIIFYDNNDKSNTSQYDILKRYIDDGFIIYLDYRGENDRQQYKCYQYCYNDYSNAFDWIAFFDVDEFPVLNKHSNIKDFITSNYEFYNAPAIHLSWLNYGDNGHIEYEDKNVLDRFNTPSKMSNQINKELWGGFRENEYVKSIVRTGINHIKYFDFIKDKENVGSVHSPGREKKLVPVNASGEKVPNFSKHFADYNIAYLKHIRTKSAEEYLYKLKRGNVARQDMVDYLNSYKSQLINMFYSCNEITSESRQIFKELYPYAFLNHEWEDILKEGAAIEKTDIDYVFPYVDCNDPEWMSQYQEASGQEMGADVIKGAPRYDPKDMLKYKFRSLEKYAPWIRNVYMIVSSPSQVPSWLDTSKVKIVYHKDFIPEEFLPTFSSLTIEMFLGNIEGLSEQFIYGNDDTFFIKKMTPYNFFYNDMKVTDITTVYVPNIPIRRFFYDVYKRSSELITGIDCRKLKTFRHCSKPFKKSHFNDILNTYGDIIYPSITKFRDKKNYSMVQMASLYDIEHSIPQPYEYKGFFIKEDPTYIYDAIIETRSKNCYEISVDALDGDPNEGYEIIKQWFDRELFSERSSYELPQGNI